MGELVSIEGLAKKQDPCSKFIREFLNDIYLGKVTPRKTAAHDLPEEANRYVYTDTAQPPRFCILKGFKPYISVVIFIGELVSHLGRKSAEMRTLKAQVAFLREKVLKLEQVRQDWVDWSNEPRASLHGKSIKEWAYLETRTDNLSARRPAQRASGSGENQQKQQKQHQ